VGFRSRFHVLRSRSHFRQYRGRRVPFSHFVRADSFSAVQRASAPIFMFCASRLIFGVTEGVRSHFYVFHTCTHFQRYRGCRITFSSFAHPDSFSAVPSASGPFFMFCAPCHVFGGAEGVGSSFSVIPKASNPVFLFCSPGLLFADIEGVGSPFYFLRSVTSFRRNRGLRLPFSFFTRPNSFSAVPMASGPVFMLYATEHNFDGSEGIRSRFHVLRSRTRFRRY
jgi:hypothetical protein